MKTKQELERVLVELRERLNSLPATGATTNEHYIAQGLIDGLVWVIDA